MIGRFLCALSWHKWGDKQYSEPFWWRNVMYRPTFVQCRRKDCHASKSARGKGIRA